MSDLNLKITPEQMKFLLELSQSIPTAFTMDPEELMMRRWRKSCLNRRQTRKGCGQRRKESRFKFEESTC